MTDNPEGDREDRLNAILLEYVEAVERGKRPDRQRLLESYPEYAEDLTAFFATRDRVHRIAAPLRAAVSGFRSVRNPDTAGSLSPDVPPSGRFPATDIGRVGDFRLLREVGRGGMGIVYEAEQLSLRRRVALKVLPFAAAVDPRHLQRFRTEAQAAAQLHHTHIVPVHAVGAEGGVHFYAMQFIDGQSLAQLLAELRRPGRPDGDPGAAGAGSVPAPLPRSGGPTVPVAALSTEHGHRGRDYFRRVAGLVGQAADALEYAHQVGIVHRDIKPANLLLDGSGHLWVTDFGLAQIRNDVGLTATGEVVGTARYMSPEQALGRPGLVDHRTDVYALGATLYELLTLSPVFDGEDGRALLRQLADEDPRPPRTLDRAIPAELETIVLKAIAKLPGDRYASAREFADDLQRFLDDRPVLARRPTLADRAAKWLRRHRTAALAAVPVLLLALVGLGVSTAVIAREHAETKAAYEREREANARERERTREAAERRAEAEDNYLRARRAVDLFVELGDEELLDFPALTPLRQRILEAAVAYYTELSDHRADPALRADLEASRVRLARLQEELAAVNEVITTLLLDQPAVQEDLGLTPEQAHRLAPQFGRIEAHLRTPSRDAKGDRRQPVAELAAECRREVEGVLTAAQYRRLRQVFLQLPGPHTFGPATLDALGLTDPQKGAVRRIQAEATQTSLRVMATAENRDDGQARFAEVWKQANDRIAAGLAPTQRGQWDQMTGPPVRGEVRLSLSRSDHPK